VITMRSEEELTALVVAATEQGALFRLPLQPIEVFMLHGAIRHTLRHPSIRKYDTTVVPRLERMIKRLNKALVIMGFTDEEIEYLNNTWEEVTD